MKRFSTLEDNLADLYKKAPSLPLNARRWIAENAWWLVLIIAIISSLALLVAIPALIALVNLPTYSYIYAYATSNTLMVVNASITLALGLLSVILLYLAVKPLKLMRRRGWTLLFANELVGIASVIISFVVTIQRFGIFSLIWGLILAAVELYFLFQIRAQFNGRVSVAREGEVIEPKRPVKKPAK